MGVAGWLALGCYGELKLGDGPIGGAPSGSSHGGTGAAAAAASGGATGVSGAATGVSGAASGLRCGSKQGLCLYVPDPLPCSPTDPACDLGIAARCGDGKVDSVRGEVCDDGNLVSGDGCSAGCEVEPGWICPSQGGECFEKAPCSNGVLDIYETCDDANGASVDGCTDGCLVEIGWKCPVPGRPCMPLCGDGKVVGAESCDEGTLNGQVGHCPNSCGIVGICGDGVVQPELGEACDDGLNDGSYDGCSPQCQLASYCGDGLVQDAEQCDLGAANSPWSNPPYGSCLANCQLGPHCGDGILQDGYEECDEGS